MSDTDQKTFIREHYPFGRCPTYRLPNGELEYHYYQVLDEYAGRWLILDWEGLRAILRDEWTPVAAEDIMWKQTHIGLRER